tara:strand:+ start:347 stop:604 length:258 start_codon:yes stop_codon:yes gene_type:complete
MKALIIVLILFFCSFTQASDNVYEKPEDRLVEEEEFKYDDLDPVHQKLFELTFELRRVEADIALMKVELEAIRECLEQWFFKNNL